MSEESRQSDRTPDTLKSDYFKLDDRSISDLFRETVNWARAIRFHSHDPQATSDWAVFFEGAENYLSLLESAETPQLEPDENPGSCPPQLALFLTFLKLFQYNQRHLNSLVSEHLKYFYSQVLGQKTGNIQADKVYTFFELARNVDSYRLEEGTTLIASSPTGKLEYRTDREIFLNKAQVIEFKAINNPKLLGKPVYALPVANSEDGLGEPIPSGKGWYPFGKYRKVKGLAELGFGIASPMLILGGGMRTVSIGFKLIEGQHLLKHHQLNADDFKVQLTGPEGWFSTSVTSVTLEDSAIVFVVSLDYADPPVVSWQNKQHSGEIGLTDEAVLKLLIHPHAFNNYYEVLRQLKFASVEVEVTVQNLQELSLSNDFGNLDATKAFHPFGYTPGVGDNFYIFLDEAACKPVNSYSVEFLWKGKPDNFKNHYEGYLGPTNSLVSSGDDFKIYAAVNRDRIWHSLENVQSNEDTFPMFDPVLEFQIPKNLQKISPDTGSREGGIRLTLAGPSKGFGHSLYPSVYAKAIITQLNSDKPNIPNEPYTPVAESVRLSYSAAISYVLQEQPTGLVFFHTEPFGINKLYPTGKYSTKFSGLPLISPDYQHSGHLFLGIDHIQAPQQLSLFFEIAEDIPKDKPNPEFYYLSERDWIPLSGNRILSDSTLGLKQSGIVLFNIPHDISRNSLRMPPGLSWIRISVPDRTDSFDQIINVRTNGLSCTLYQPLTADTSINRLPPDSIKSFKTKKSEIKKIHQPYMSFGGKPTETTIDYFARVSEKLRHKSKGISKWDIERLLLESFPEIFQVKCIPHSNDKGQVTPGSVHIIVIPKINPNQTRKVLKPTVTSANLASISAYVKKHLSHQVQAYVTNPRFQEISVISRVNFKDNVDTGFYIKQLQRDIQYFLSPWAFISEFEITLGSKLYRSSIIEFIESKPYVNFILSIDVLIDGTATRENEILADERSVNVSAPYHKIIPVGAQAVRCQTGQGIDQMIVDVNFDVQ